ncbi:hypothetical protein [Lysobacter sp. Root690]|uniref:hypothetical protein n=1 Tax=Lysobacter sp. Root690 TaxID=1736588 RepID=UPI0006F2F2F2|nr:hypothetical protein [Lysobacter sp. Root690]KRB07691.1 hypothetical protein ASD86_07670 [Lysobacter sp. Root690]
MARAVSPEKLREYAELEKYLHVFATCVWKIPQDAEHHPTTVGRRNVARYGVSRALTGLRQAVNDTLEALDDWPPESIAALDALLRGEGIVTVTELRRRSSRQLRRIVKAGEIRSETEYYLVKGIVDGCVDTITAEELASFNMLIAGFEAKVANAT